MSMQGYSNPPSRTPSLAMGGPPKLRVPRGGGKGATVLKPPSSLLSPTRVDKPLNLHKGHV